MHATISISSSQSFAADLTGFTTGLLISGLLLILTLRAARLRGTPLANIGFAICGLLWSAGGLAATIFMAAGMRHQSHAVLASEAIRYAAMVCVSIPLIAIWRPYATAEWQKRAGRMLYLFGCLASAILTVLFAAAMFMDNPPVSVRMLGHMGGMTMTAVMIAGAGMLLRHGSTPRAVYVPSLAIALFGGAGAAAITISQYLYQTSRELSQTLFSVGMHLLLLLIFCTVFLFARFRYADIFIRYSVRIFLAGAFATFLGFTLVFQASSHIVQQWPVGPAAHVLVVTLLIYGLLLSFSFIDQRLAALVNHWLFHPPDFRAATRHLSEQLDRLDSDNDVMRAVETSVKATLQLSDARLAAATPGESESEPSEHSFEWRIPITVAGRIGYILSVVSGPARQGLVTHDINYLRTVAALCGNKLDSIRHEREAVEQRSRESMLVQQVTEAELRALRAQINPHFLFNSLNTIADLVVRDPARAETMTLRLASVFRHVLAHAARPLTSIQDEMDFLRAYLHIEEVRFGDRLKVEFQVAPETAAIEIPSLILQPLVENSLKHGLAPKTAPGRLWIAAGIAGPDVFLRVEDDGMGLQSTTEGTGLANVRERLRTLYGDRASLTLESREGGGVRVTVRIPV